MSSRGDGGVVGLSAGCRVRILPSYRAPYPGRHGIIAGIDESDKRGAYLVRFDDGTQFRYEAHEIELAESQQTAY